MKLTMIFTTWNRKKALTTLVLSGVFFGFVQQALAISRCHSYGIEAYAMQEAGRQLGCNGKFFSRTDPDNPFIHKKHCELHGNVNNDNYERAKALLNCID